MESSDELTLEWSEFHKWVNHAQEEVKQKLDLKPPKGYPDYTNYCFVKKNSNRYFKKHLGFTINSNFKKPEKDHTINIIDRKKLMIFRLKYGL